ncbi:hypothetical protein OF83DRAFT_1282723 [Amylostereum chailletii]|nr:hypothetical protein OF83DRAFT_1282723 [Amylostereum chailletii]
MLTDGPRCLSSRKLLNQPSQGVLQDFHGFCPNPGVGAAQFASELDNASPNELHGSQPTDFAFTNVPQYLAPQTSDRRFPTYAAPFVQQYAVHQFDFAPVSEREMPSTISTTYQQQNNHQHTSRAPASALSTRGHAIQASAPAFTAPNMAFANIASSSRTSPAFEQLRNHIGGPHPFRQRPTIPLHDDGEGWNPFHNTFGRCATALDTRRPQTSNGFRTASRGHIQRSPTAGPSRNPHGSVSAFSSSTMELYGQGLNQTLVADNDLSSKQSFEGDFPQDLLSFGATSSPATGSSVPPSHARKRKYDAMDDRKGKNLDGDSAPAHSIQAPSADNTSLTGQRSTAPLLPAGGALFSNYYAWGTLNTNDCADEAAFFNAELQPQTSQSAFQGVLQDFHGFRPNPGVGVAQFASESDNASPNELHSSRPTDFAFANVSQHFAPQTPNRRFPTYAAPFVPQYATHQFDFTPVSEQRMPYTTSTTYQQQRNHRYTSRTPASAISSRGHAIQASVPAFTAPNMAFANMASSSRTSPTFEQLRSHIGPRPLQEHPTMSSHNGGEGWNPFHNTFGRCATALDTRRPRTSSGFRTSREHIPQLPTAGPSGNPRDSMSAFPLSTTELHGQGLNQALQHNNDVSSEQSLEENSPQDLPSFGTTSPFATGSGGPPTSNGKRKHDAMDAGKGKKAAKVGNAPATKTPARCLIDGCGKLFNRYPDLIRHQEQSNIHRGPNEPLYHCTYCWGLSSARRDNVKRHFRTCPRYTGKIRVGSRRRLVYDGQLAYLTMAEANIWKALQDIEGQDTVQDEVVGGDDGKGDGEGDGGDEDATDGEEEDGGSMLDGEDD